jgi:hypothetical protein
MADIDLALVAEQQQLDVVRGHINQHFWELLDVYVAAKG